MNKESKILIGVVGTFFILLVILGGVHFVTGGGDEEHIDFIKRDTVSENAVIIHLTEEDYEKYPMLRDIPKTLDVDKSIFGTFLMNFGFVDKETAYAIWNTYGDNLRGEDYKHIDRFIEHEGTLYAVRLSVS